VTGTGVIGRETGIEREGRGIGIVKNEKGTTEMTDGKTEKRIDVGLVRENVVQPNLHLPHVLNPLWRQYPLQHHLRKMKHSRSSEQNMKRGRRIERAKKHLGKLKLKPWHWLGSLHQVCCSPFFSCNPRFHITWSLPASAELPAKPAGQLNRAALGGLGLKGLPLKPEFTKSMTASMDDSVETKRKLEKLEDMPAVDMTMNEGEPIVGDLEVDDDDEEANRMDQALRKKKAEQAMEVEVDDDLDPLDAFMSGVKEEVKKVNMEDMKKMDNANGRLNKRLDEGIEDEDVAEEALPDELDATDLNPEDILALAAKKAKKKELAAVDHARVKYEHFRKEFYIPPPDIAAMTDEEAELLRLELDSIKIRGVDCPRPVTKWSHFGLPASWCVPPCIHSGLGLFTGPFSAWR